MQELKPSAVWPRHLGDVANRRLSSVATAKNRGEVAWVFKLRGSHGFGPLVGPDGSFTLSVLHERPDRTTIKVLGADGEERSHHEIPAWCFARAVMDRDGIVYCASADKHLCAVHPTAGVLWRQPIGSAHPSAATLVSDCVCVAAGKRLLCFSLEGRRVWETSLKLTLGDSNQGPAVTDDGCIAVATGEPASRAALFLVNLDGTLRWQKLFGTCPDTEVLARVEGSPWVLADGRICVNVSMDRLAEVGATGRIYSPVARISRDLPIQSTPPDRTARARHTRAVIALVTVLLIPPALLLPSVTTRRAAVSFRIGVKQVFLGRPATYELKGINGVEPVQSGDGWVIKAGNDWGYLIWMGERFSGDSPPWRLFW